MSTQEALTNREYIGLRGEKYKSLSALAEAYNINKQNLWKRIRKGLSTQESLRKLLDRDITYNDTFGNEYDTLKQMANKWNIAYNKLYLRLGAGIEICVALVAKDKVQLKFVGLDGKARYKLGNCEDPLTARQIIEHYRPDLLEAYDKNNPKGEYNPYKISKEG